MIVLFKPSKSVPLVMGAVLKAEHRAILEHVLLRSKRKSLAQVLASMPDVGWDKDFERVDTDQTVPHVFD